MKTRKAVVVGECVSGSLSPLIFNYWFLKYSVNGKYNYKEIKRDSFDNEIKKIINKNALSGLNITTPYKEVIIQYLDELDEHSKKIGAVNCVTIKNKKIYGSNTDWIGYSRALREKTSLKDRINRQAIIIGFGGAAKAILYALIKLKYKRIHIFNRTVKKLNSLNNNNVEIHAMSEINKYIKSSNLIINTVPINVIKNLNIPKKLPKNVIISDIVYQPLETNFLKYFENPKNKIYGISMLINQAIPCFKKWYGIVPTADKKLFEIIEKKLGS